MLVLKIVLITLFGSGFCHRILVVFPMSSHSHYVLSSKIVKELADRGHNITFVNPYPGRDWGTENVTEISTADLTSTVDENRKLLYKVEEMSVFGRINFVLDFSKTLSESIMKNQNIQKLLKSKESYDLLILAEFLNEASMVFAHKFRVPVIQLATMPQYAWSPFLLGNPTPSSYVPNSLSTFTGKMDFTQRFLNSIYDIYAILCHQFVVLPHHRELVRKYVPDSDDLYDFVSNVSLVLVNSHMSIFQAIPQPPNVIDIGGAHLEPPGKLPEDLQRFLDESPEGVILFSMGTNLKSADLPDSRRNDILKVFSKLKLKVLWKWEQDDLPGQPENVVIKKWLPQKEVLAHPNVKVFITHGGLFSLMESVYFGVPLVGIPIFSDQHLNVATAEARGYALTVPLKSLTEETLTAALEKILNDPSFEENIKIRSKIMKDRPQKPIDTAIYWIEYVIRHKGAPHLKYGGSDLTWYQRNLIDVSALILAICVLNVYFIYLLAKSLFLLILAKSKAKTE